MEGVRGNLLVVENLSPPAGLEGEKKRLEYEMNFVFGALVGGWCP